MRRTDGLHHEGARCTCEGDARQASDSLLLSCLPPPTRRTGHKERIWTSDTQHYFESIVSLLSDQQPGPIPLHDLKLLLSRESKDEPTQYFVKR